MIRGIKRHNIFGAFRVTLASQHVEKSSTTVDVNLGKIFSLIVCKLCKVFEYKFLQKKKIDNKYLSRGSIIGGRSFRKPLYFVLPRPQTAFVFSWRPKPPGFMPVWISQSPTLLTIFRIFLTLCPGGGTLYFLGGYVPPGTPNWYPVLEKISPKIDTPF